MIFGRSFISPFLYTKSSYSFAIKAQKIKQKTFYQILEVPATAPQSNIRKNYLKLAKIYHPDVYKGSDSDRFQKINKAYQTLSNQKKRQEYDQQIGLRQSQSKNQEYEFSQNKAANKNWEQKKSNDFTYQKTGKKQQQLNIDEQYLKFFGKKKQTDFQEIRLHQQVQFRQKNEDERIRSRFSQYYDNTQAQMKTKRQMPYEDMLDDQIKQRNTHHQDILKKIQRNQKLYSESGIKWQKRMVYFVAIVLAGILYPLFISFWTKYRMEQEQKEKIRKMVNQIQRKQEEAQIRSRFQY